MSDPRQRRPGPELTAGGLVVLTLLAVALGVPTPVPGLLVLTALASTGSRLVRHRRRGAVDALLVGVGGTLVGVVLTGLALGLSGIGLRPSSWAVGLAALAGLGLIADRMIGARLPAPEPSSPDRARLAGPALRLAPWLVAAGVVVVAAVGLSVRSLSAADEPPLALALGSVHGTDVQVVVTTGEAVGPLEIRTTSEGTDVSYPLFDVGDDGTRSTTLSLPRHGRFTITLNYPDQTEPLRTLILDR